MTEPRISEENAERNRCYWRSRRGLLELDLLLPPFVKACFESLSAVQRRTLHRLLDCEDQDIWDWFQQRSAPEDRDIGDLIVLIRAFNDRADSAD
jgi:antitoxin CptB